MNKTQHQHIVNQFVKAADDAVRALLTTPGDFDAAKPPCERLIRLQQQFQVEFPALDDPVDFWETLWLRTDLMRDQWNRIEKAARRANPQFLTKIQPLLNRQRRLLYIWARSFICQNAATIPTEAHFELGIDTRRADYRGLHERLEGLYESIKRIGQLPAVAEGLSPPADRVNFAIIYGCGWNVSAYSILTEAANFPHMNAFVAFDHPGTDLYSRVGRRPVRLATAALMRNEDGRFLLTAFRQPMVLHFVCPHQWTGPAPQRLGLPVLRSDLTLRIVTNKLNTYRALQWYAQRTDVEFPFIPTRTVPQSPVPADMDRQADLARDTIQKMQAEGINELIVKPAVGEQARNVGFFTLPPDQAEAVEHAAALSLESPVVIQQRIRPPGTEDFNWRVLVAKDTDDEPVVVGRFARKGPADALEMVPDRQMLEQIGVTGEQATQFLNRLEAISRNAFRAVAAFAAETEHQFPYKPLAGGSYAVPHILGVDLIGDGYIMEVNGNEVAGMWTDDRLYPHTKGRSSRTVLACAQHAAEAYKSALENQ